jgi:hypothetical protein
MVRFLDGTPVVVKSVSEDMEVIVSVVLEGDVKKVSLDDLDLSPVPLGWCNLTEHGAYYLARVAMRKDWKQGLREGNYAIMFPKGRTSSKSGVGTSNAALCVSGSTLVTYDTALAYAKKGYSKAFHREWAFIKGALYHKWNHVGTLVDGNIEWLPQYSYLESRFIEDKHHANMAKAGVN